MAIEINKGSQGVGVGLLPGRKSHCLFTREGGLLTTVAYFRSEADANHFLKVLAEVFDVDLSKVAKEVTDAEPSAG